jgi:hypothetical protein
MTWDDYKLDDTVFTTDEPLTLWQAENGIVEINKNAIAIPIKLDTEQRGFIFQGKGKLLLDTIIETENGAIGKPVEKELNEPFIMLSDTEDIQKHLRNANKQSLAEAGYENEKEFRDKAENLLDKLSERGRIHNAHCCSHHYSGSIFAFPNKADKLDMLIAKGSKIVYKATDKVFVSNKSNVVLKTPEEVIVSHNRRSVITKGRGHCCVY